MSMKRQKAGGNILTNEKADAHVNSSTTQDINLFFLKVAAGVAAGEAAGEGNLYQYIRNNLNITKLLLDHITTLTTPVTSRAPVLRIKFKHTCFYSKICTHTASALLSAETSSICDTEQVLPLPSPHWLYPRG